MRNMWFIIFVVACRIPDEHFTRCLGSVVRICFSALPPTTPVVMTSNTDIDTDASPMCDQGNDNMDDYCVVAGGDFTLTGGARIRAHGKKPLVLLSTGTIALQATIDVSSKHTTGADDIGAGGNASTCEKGQEPTGAGGGYGGSFGGSGGKGQTAQGGTLGGIPAKPLLGWPGFRGGCPGGSGHGSNGGSDGGPGGAGGSGGGVIALVAAEIHLDGPINASGAGGQGGPGAANAPQSSGGGGGGSGGLIVFDAPTIVAGRNASLFANGGGGGEGGIRSWPGEGQPGGESSAPTVAAPGGIDANDLQNGDGASGSSGGTLEGQDAVDGVSSMGGGGGGGGGAGFIHAPGVAPMAIAPPSTDP